MTQDDLEFPIRALFDGREVAHLIELTKKTIVRDYRMWMKQKAPAEQKKCNKLMAKKTKIEAQSIPRVVDLLIHC